MKKYLSGIIAIVLVSVFSAFSLAPTTDIWYDFSGTSSQYSDLSKYAPDSDNTADCPLAGPVRCEILAPPIVGGNNDGKPNLQAIHDERFKNN
jgi:hypothetical protein